MKLVVSLTSPYARKIRVALAEKGLPFTLEVDIPWLAETSVPDYNPLGKVPALVADDGEVWYDSPVIAEYLETLGGSPLLPAERTAALPVRQTEALADGITDAAVAAFLESRRPPGNRTRPASNASSPRSTAAWPPWSNAWWPARASARQPQHWRHCRRMHALGYLDFRFAHLVWRSTHPSLAAWAATCMARPSFVDTVPPPA
jgi:glutathione S-transferase